jgi:hypothetical protein
MGEVKLKRNPAEKVRSEPREEISFRFRSGGRGEIFIFR